MITTGRNNGEIGGATGWNVANGLFIVFEGGEGSGKSTQAELLHRRLLEAQRPAALVREPGTTTPGPLPARVPEEQAALDGGIGTAAVRARRGRS